MRHFCVNVVGVRDSEALYTFEFVLTITVVDGWRSVRHFSFISKLFMVKITQKSSHIVSRVVSVTCDIQRTWLDRMCMCSVRVSTIQIRRWINGHIECDELMENIISGDYGMELNVHFVAKRNTCQWLEFNEVHCAIFNSVRSSYWSRSDSNSIEQLLNCVNFSGIFFFGHFTSAFGIQCFHWPVYFHFRRISLITS